MLEYLHKHNASEREKASQTAGSDAGGTAAAVTTAQVMRKASCACGGGCPACRRNSGELKISQPNDSAEIEADQIADRVMRMPDGHRAEPKHVIPHTDTIHPKCSGCEEEAEDEDELQRKTSPVGSASAGEAPSDHVSKAIGGGGSGLAAGTREFFEPRLGYDLGAVRVHTGSDASASARSIGAEAYTLGQNIVFNQDRYQPETDEGRHLLAHELAHVAQQLGRGKLSRKIQPYSAKCTKLSSKRSIAGLIRGTEAHTLITDDFKSRVTGATGASIPGASADVIRTDAICGGPSTMIDPEEIGDPGALSSRGKVDLARKKGTTLEIAEIKPAAIECLVDGEVQLARYIYQGNSDLLPEGKDDEELKGWKRRKKIKTLVPMKSSTYPARTLRVLDVQGELKIEMAWCNPGLLAYKVSLDTTKKKKDGDKKKSKDKAADADGPDSKKPATDTPDGPDSKKPAADTPDSPDTKKPHADAPDGPDAKKPHPDAPDAPDTKSPKAKPKLKNFGFGICLLCDVGGGGNAGVGVGILVDGQSYGTVSAGVVYDANGNAVGTAGVGAGMHMSGDSAGSVSASVGSDVSGESALTAGVSAAEGSSSNSLASASAGTSKGGDTNAIASAAKGGGSDAQGTSILEAGKGGPKDGGGGGTKVEGATADAGTTDVKGDKSGGASGGSPGGTTDAGTKADAGAGKGTGTTSGQSASDAGVSATADAGPGGTGNEKGLQIPGTTPEQLNEAVKQAAELDALLQSATPAQREFMEFLASQERAGYFPVSKFDWVKNVMNATAGLDERGAQTLSKYSWADSNVSEGDLKAAVDEALKRTDVDPQQTSHNYVFGQDMMLPFTADDIDYEAVASAGIKHSDKLKVGKEYSGLVVFYFKKKDGTDFFARVFELPITYESVNKDDEDGKPHHFAFGQEIVFVDGENKVVTSYRGFRTTDEGLNDI
jgi:hypothetical protein